MKITIVLPIALAACTHSIDSFDRTDVRSARDLDILYVFDDNIGRDRFDQMAAQLGDLQTQLAAVDGQLPSLHVGVVTTDLGTQGTLDAMPSAPFGHCAGVGKAGKLVTFGEALPGGYLEDLRGADGTRDQNFASGDLSAELARLTNPAFGTAVDGCEFIQPFEAMRRALDPANNPGFLRDDAMLSVVFLTAEDDCSIARNTILDQFNSALGPMTTFRCTSQGVICDDDPSRPGDHANCRPRESQLLVNVSEYEQFLTGLKQDPHDVVVSAVAGPRDPFTVRDAGGPVLVPSCQGAAGSAKPAVRIGALVDAFGGATVDACAQTAAYQQLAAPIVNPQRSCLPNLRRSDGEDCHVIEAAGGAEVELARCADGAAAPCWFTYSDAAACPSGDNLGIAIQRGTTTAPADATIQATCFVK